MPAPLLEWLDAHPSVYVWGVGSLIAAALVLALRSLWRTPAAGERGHDWAWGAMIVGGLAAGRWPTWLIQREFNPDESQLLAGAHALWHDPVFWRSVDGATAGPLDFLALWPAGWLCGWDSYAGARLTAFVLLAVGLTLMHQCLALVQGRAAARLAGLGALGLEALTNSVDLLHYSTELVPAACLAAAGYAAIRRWAGRGGPGWSGLGGLLLGAVPLSKLQAAPLALALGLAWLWAELRAGPNGSRRHRVYLLAGALLPVTLFVTQVLLAGEWANFVTSYFTFNLGYVAAGDDSLASLFGKLAAKAREQDSLLLPWLAGSALWALLTLRPRLIRDRTRRLFTLTTVLAGVLALVCILRAGRPFLHYWQLAVLPGTLVLGALTGNLLTDSPADRRRIVQGLVAAAAIVLTGYFVQHRVRHPNFFVGALGHFQLAPGTELSRHVARQAGAADAIAIWGWSNYVYVETGLRQATRDAHFERAVTPGPLQHYFRGRFLADFRRARPGLFLDSVGPGSLYFRSPRFAHDRDFPELAAVVRADYVLVDEVDGARIYRRRDQPGH